MKEFIFQYQSKVEVLTTEGEQIFLDKWFVRTSEPVRDRKRWQHLYPGKFFFETPMDVVVTMDKWFQLASEPEEIPENRYYAYPNEFRYTEPIVVIAEVNLDAWFKQTSEPVRSKENRNWIYPSFTIDPDVLTQGEEILVDKWFVRTSEPVRVPKDYRWVYPAWIADAQLYLMLYNPSSQTFKPIYPDIIWGKTERRWQYPYIGFVEQIRCVDLWGPVHTSEDIIFLLPDGRLAKRLTDIVYLEM